MTTQKTRYVTVVIAISDNDKIAPLMTQLSDSMSDGDLKADGFQVVGMSRGDEMNRLELVEEAVERNDMDTVRKVINANEVCGESQFDVVVRVTFTLPTSEVEDWEGRCPKWEISDCSNQDGTSTARMDRVCRIGAYTREQASKRALDYVEVDGPSLGTNITAENIQYWVDSDNDDDIILVEV